MAKQSVNIGTTANDSTGSPLRTAFDFINDNTNELYTLLGNGTTLGISGDVTMSGGAVTIAADAVEGSMIEDNVALAGNPTTTTQNAGDNSTKIATTAYADTAVANAIDSAPAALDTLNELAASLNDDANFAATMTTALSGKLATSAGAVGTSNIADDAVTADKLANSINTEIAANTSKVTNATHTGDVTGATALTIANDAVNGDKIADDAIDSEHYVDGSIDAAHIASSAVTNAKINNGAVNMDKLSATVVVTESEGISSNDNDTTLPTSAAVKDYVDTQTGGISVNVISGNTTAANNNLYVLTANLTLTLPSSPSAGNTVKISNRSGVATCTVARNSEKIMGATSDLTIDKLNAGFEMIYSGAAQGWILIGVEGTSA